MTFLFASVIGVPGAQGSKAFKGMVKSKSGRMVPRLIESSKKVAPWRDAVAAAVASANTGGIYFDDAVRLTVTFIMPRKGEPKGWTRHHTRAPDLDKLVRSTCDAMKTSGAWRDDCLVVELVAKKVSAEEGEPSGARIIIESLPPKEKPVVQKKAKPERKPAGRKPRQGRGLGSDQPALAV